MPGQSVPHSRRRPLGLGVLSVEEENLDQSYRISNDGTFVVGSIQVNKAGLKPGVSLAQQAAAAHAHAAPAAAAASSPSKSVSSEFGPENIVELRKLGKGASGTVYLALHLPTLTLLAQKTLGVFDQSVRHQFVKEMKAYMHSQAVDRAPELASLSASAIGVGQSAVMRSNEHVTLEASLASLNENAAAMLQAGAAAGPASVGAASPLIRFFGASYEDGRLSIFIEYMDSGSLEDVVHQRGPMSEPVLRSVMRQACQGLQLVHQRHQVHRDIKPGALCVRNEWRV